MGTCAKCLQTLLYPVLLRPEPLLPISQRSTLRLGMLFMLLTQEPIVDGRVGWEPWSILPKACTLSSSWSVKLKYSEKSPRKHVRTVSKLQSRIVHVAAFPSGLPNRHLLASSDRIARNRKTIVCPMIDVIDHDDFRYETQAGDAMRGAFDWEMYYKRIPIPPELQKADPSDPFE